MIRVQAVLIASAALALAVPFGTAMAQTVTGEIGTAGPIAGEPSSTTMVKAEMKQGTYYTEPASVQPVQAVSTGPRYAATADQSCGPANAAAITDEYGHKYNCRGDRLR
jgi:hypothetical protein